MKGIENSPGGAVSMTEQKQKIHPHKFTLYVAIASILMMFAGLTSAYIVKRNQAGWEEVETPVYFWLSTVVILVSSLTIQLALRAFKQKAMMQYRRLVGVTLILGVAFLVFQLLGFSWMWERGVHFRGASAGQFLYIIAGLHGLHVLGGVVVLAIMFLKAFFGRTINYNTSGIEVASTYWHFVDALWLYLLIFFVWIG
jgi:cytochrome c oxidase subunit 3